MHQNSLMIFEKHARPYFEGIQSVLEIGPSGTPSAYQNLIGKPGLKWDTIDIANKKGYNLTYLSKGEYDFGIPSDTYDVVLSGQVFEHVRKIWRWMPEVARVAKPGGRVITISPVSYPYHEAPHDCWRVYPEGMKALCEDSGLEVELAKWESIEGEKYKRTIGGKGSDRLGWLGRYWRMLAFVGFPMQVAFDMITVARKL
jgi:SAM-dependent methyltransferase